MTHTVSGQCHCGNLSFELHTRVPASEIRARACDCSFCRMHGTRNWSDPQGQVAIRVRDEDRLNRYRFGLKTADFFICKECGAYVGAVLSDSGSSWSTVNLRLSNLSVEEGSVSYGAEGASDRVERRKRDWTPTTVGGGG